MRVHLHFTLACCAGCFVMMYRTSVRERIFIFLCNSIDQYALHEIIPELLLFRLNLDIAGFVRAAVRDGLKRDEILGSLHIITNTPDATEKMPLFAVVAQEKDLNRNEILVWLHVSYGGSMDPEHLSQRLRIPPRAAEEALTTLKEKGIIKNGRVL